MQEMMVNFFQLDLKSPDNTGMQNNDATEEVLVESEWNRICAN